ncbi:hypothetical protein, partial [Pseudomonas aeruginosa]
FFLARRLGFEALLTLRLSATVIAFRPVLALPAIMTIIVAVVATVRTAAIALALTVATAIGTCTVTIVAAAFTATLALFARSFPTALTTIAGTTVFATLIFVATTRTPQKNGLGLGGLSAFRRSLGCDSLFACSLRNRCLDSFAFDSSRRLGHLFFGSRLVFLGLDAFLFSRRRFRGSRSRGTGVAGEEGLRLFRRHLIGAVTEALQNF